MRFALLGKAVPDSPTNVPFVWLILAFLAMHRRFSGYEKYVLVLAKQR